MSLSPYQIHVERWSRGCGSVLCPRVQHICLARGTIESDVVFVGEGPGEAEDSIGEPFVGPAGQFLDEIIKASVPDDLTYSLTNLVGCIPREETLDSTGRRGKQVEPPPDAIWACSERLVEFLEIAKPRLIVCVGKVAGSYLSGPKYAHSIDIGDTPTVEIHHPAYILRAPYVQQGSLKAKCLVVIRDGILKYIRGEET